MNSLIENKEGGRVTLKVTIPAEEFTGYYNDAVKKTSREHNFPGFRKGHAPKPIVIAHLGETYVLTEAASLAISKTYNEASQENNIKPFGDPEYDIVQVEPDKDFIYTIKVEVLPEITLPEYKGLKAVKKVQQVTDNDIDNVLQNLQKRHAQLIAIEDRDVVEKEDYILFDFKGFIDDEPFEGGAAENYTLKIGSNSFIPGFEDQLIGKKIGEEEKVQVTFPADYHQETLAGKEAVFKVNIKEIKKEELPAIDDELAKDVSEYETLSELKENIKVDLEVAASNKANQELENELLDRIVSAADFEVPPTMVELQLKHMLQDFKSQVEYQGLSWESYLEHSGKTEDALKEDFKPNALKVVRNYFVLNEIAAIEKIDVTDADLDQKYAELAANYQIGKETLRDYYEKNNRVEDLIYDLTTQKTLRFLADNATVEEEKIASESKDLS